MSAPTRRLKPLAASLAGAVLAASALAGCAWLFGSGLPGHLIAARFADLPGWNEEDHGAVLRQLRAQCEKPLPADPIHARLKIDAARWASLCRLARASGEDAAAARTFFENQFQPYQVRGDGGLFTGYFEAELPAAARQTVRFKAPLYRPPPELARGVAFASRAEIDAGALKGRDLELAWVEDRVAALEIQIQGSGRLRLPDGKILRLGYAADNGRDYTAIGRVLIEQGALTREEATWPAIKQWLRAHPAQADAVIDKNQRYIFFRVLPHLDGPPGSLGVPLTPNRSIAVDRAFIPLGMPVMLDTSLPDGAPLRRLMLAQDTGGAIKGPVRGDIFFGSGARAEQLAGAMRQPGRWWLLLPKPE